ncbi:MAG: peptide deformylase [Gemmatimonadota bacterium]
MSTLYLRHYRQEDVRNAGAVEEIDAEVEEQIDGMLSLLRKTRYPAIAGPQVGLYRRIIAVDLSRAGRSPVVLINPEVEAVSLERQIDLEGCLLLPGLMARVARAERVTVRGLARTGHPVRIEAGGLLARILQHQIDHLDGTLILDRVDTTQRALLARRARVQVPRCFLPESRLVGVAG